MVKGGVAPEQKPFRRLRRGGMDSEDETGEQSDVYETTGSGVEVHEPESSDSVENSSEIHCAEGAIEESRAEENDEEDDEEDMKGTRGNENEPEIQKLTESEQVGENEVSSSLDLPASDERYSLYSRSALPSHLSPLLLLCVLMI